MTNTALVNADNDFWQRQNQLMPMNLHFDRLNIDDSNKLQFQAILEHKIKLPLDNMAQVNSTNNAQLVSKESYSQIINTRLNTQINNSELKQSSASLTAGMSYQCAQNILSTSEKSIEASPNTLYIENWVLIDSYADKFKQSLWEINHHQVVGFIKLPEMPEHELNALIDNIKLQLKSKSLVLQQLTINGIVHYQKETP